MEFLWLELECIGKEFKLINVAWMPVLGYAEVSYGCFLSFFCHNYWELLYHYVVVFCDFLANP